MKRKLYVFTVISFLVSVILSQTAFPNLQAQNTMPKTGIFDTFSNIGSSRIFGAATFNQASQTYRLTGSGSNIWFGHDNCSLLSKKMNGDFILQTRIHFIGVGHVSDSDMGLLFRK